jgi:hypothetical protein
VVVVFFVCARAGSADGNRSVVRTNRAAINVRRTPTRSVKGDPNSGLGGRTAGSYRQRQRAGDQT